MTRTLHLHIGEPKTATTYLQARLDGNRAELAAGGVLVPGRRIDQIRGAQEMMGRPDDGSRGKLAGRWQSLAEEVLAFPGRAAVISMESLVRARPPHVRRALAAFPGLEIRVVLTLRDLARVVPAQWQESLQFGHTWSLAEYLSAVQAPDPRAHAAGRDFWAQHDLARELRVWGDEVGLPHVTVVPLPRSSPPETLWDRFAAALDLPPGRYQAVDSTNPSLGAVSAELMRRVNAALPADELTLLEYGRLCRNLLSKQILAQRATAEPKVALPAEFLAWAEEQSAQVVTTLRQSGVIVIGDLDDLRSPAATGPLAGASAAVGESAISEAAVSAIVGLLLAERDRSAAGRRLARQEE